MDAAGEGGKASRRELELELGGRALEEEGKVGRREEREDMDMPQQKRERRDRS